MVFWWCVLNSLAPANHTQPFIADMLILSCCACADALKLTRPLCRLILISVTNQSSDLLRPLIMRNSDLNNQAIGGKSNPIRQGTLTRAFCTNRFHASAMKKGWISIRYFVRNSDLNNQAIGGKSNPIRQGTLTRKFCTNRFHASAMKKGWISIRYCSIPAWPQVLLTKPYFLKILTKKGPQSQFLPKNHFFGTFWSKFSKIRPNSKKKKKKKRNPLRFLS